MDHLHWVLDGDDVRLAVVVDPPDHGGDGGRLSRPRRPRDEHQPAGLPGQRLGRGRQAELVERGDLGADQADRHAHETPLAVRVHAEAAHALERVADVDLARLPELLGLGVREQLDGQPLRVSGVEGLEGGPVQEPVHADDRGQPHLQVQVAGPGVDHVLQVLSDRHRRSSCRLLGTRP